MRRQKVRQLRIVFLDVILVRQQRRIAGDHGGQSRTLFQELDELILDGGYIAFKGNVGADGRPGA